LLLATIFPENNFVGLYGKFLGSSNITLFGYLSYLIPFYIMWILYAFYKNLKVEVFEKIFAVFILFISFSIVQSLLLSKGIFGNLFVNAMKPFIGNIGIILIILFLFAISFLIFRLDMPTIKLPKKNKLLNNLKEDKKQEFIKNKNVEEVKKENFKTPEIKEDKDNIEQIQKKDIEYNVEDYIKHSLETIHNIDTNSILEEDFTNDEIKSDDNKQEQIDDEVKEFTKVEEIKEINKNIEKKESTEIEKLKKEPKEESQKIDKKVEIVSELDENKELLKDIEKGKIAKPKDFKLPNLNFLKVPPKREKHINEVEIDKKVNLLLNKLRNFKIEGDVVRTYTGPVVTTFEFKPLAHIKVSKILNLQDDLAMALKASTIRIQAPVPGKDVVGIEIPNEEIETIYLREILETDLFKNSKAPLLIALGKDIVGKPFVTDLAKLPHLLIAGTTGSGKSVGINAMILSLLYRNSPDDLKLMMIDPKMLEFSIYNDIPHLLTPVITEPKKAIAGLSNMVKEMERRYKLMSDGKVKNIENYNAKFTENKIPYIVVIIDELADLMMTGGKDVEYSIARLAQMARASGIHLIVATQRPSVDVVTGLIKANLPSRISYKVGQKIDSKVVLDTFGAESLLGRGDMLFTPPGSSTLVRLHAPFTTEEEIEQIVEFLKAQRSVNYDEHFLSESLDSEISEEIEDKDELYEDAKQIIINENKTSISYLQRRLQIGYNRAANIIEQLERSGFLSQPNSKGQREIVKN
jgi:S-DNA-T family DNA segregation ATPase FtsK/SpoIIIE